MISEATLDRLASWILDVGALDIRKVPATKLGNEKMMLLPLENQPYLYASGNFGPGYVSIKGLVGQQRLIVMLCSYLAFEIAEKWPVRAEIDFIAGNVTGGVVPGWIVSQKLSELYGKTIPFVYIRELRKTGGQRELITGIHKNPEICLGNEALDMEELVNFAETIRNGANCLREAGYKARKGACILYYGNPEADKQLAEVGIEMAYLPMDTTFRNRTGYGMIKPWTSAES